MAPPNILLITCDNLGYGDLACYNPSSELQTPNLERLSQQGGRLTDFYTASPTCSVSRACLLTGRIPQRHRLQEQLPGIEGNYGPGLRSAERLLPEYLRQAPIPYATACFGKWNIGFASGSRPTDRGFEQFLGHASGNIDYFHHNYRERHDLYQGTVEDGLSSLHCEGEYSTDLFADAAVEFITSQAARQTPWFCYLPFNAPHFPSPYNKLAGQPNRWQAPPWAFEAIGLSPEVKTPRSRYAAVVYALDHAIGRVLESLDRTSQRENTFVFFMSDNGAFRLGREGLDVGLNTPLRGGGVTCWEGGLRVPALVRWPEKIRAGTVISEPLWSPDLLVACMELAGAKLPPRVIIDGRDPLAALAGGKPSPHTSLFFAYRQQAALRQGDWKIIREKPELPWQLYHLAADIGEARDLANSNPEQVARLSAEFVRWTDSFAKLP